jgi:hypothetical protein
MRITEHTRPLPLPFLTATRHVVVEQDPFYSYSMFGEHTHAFLCEQERHRHPTEALTSFLSVPIAVMHN